MRSPGPCFPDHTVLTTIHLLTSENNKANKALNVLASNSTAILHKCSEIKCSMFYNTSNVGQVALMSLNIPKYRLRVNSVSHKVH